MLVRHSHNIYTILFVLLIAWNFFFVCFWFRFAEINCAHAMPLLVSSPIKIILHVRRCKHAIFILAFSRKSNTHSPSKCMRSLIECLFGCFLNCFYQQLLTSSSLWWILHLKNLWAHVARSCFYAVLSKRIKLRRLQKKIEKCTRSCSFDSFFCSKILQESRKTSLRNHEHFN